ncbi:MarR family transcriptional regulator [Spongiactinospora sp. TRM90649]|uniref:MarR family winged helix-turn-helix transcriptional regulator n=1 Tax=Spongiactinospora sp. TRM90649 TaxID=3031114 RepID=UPI0023FA2434|nr:MarR family transcriptional regulator [Spongiactinospora sp. TRM90649]MDF5755117.1 MarR family transcriptional regulator [Spongiactinospora sp. TRM90649]
MSAQDEGLLDDTGFLLAYASGVVVRLTNARLARFDLRVRHYSVLALVCDREGLSQRDIAEFLGMDPSPVVSLIDALESRGLVARRPHSVDRRAREVVATPEGHALRDLARLDVVAARQEFLAGLPKDEQDQLLVILRHLALAGSGRGGVDADTTSDA